VKSVGPLEVPYNISWVDEERDTSCWLGNCMQREAFDKLYSVADRVRICTDRRIKQDWDYLQASNNFRFMTTKPTSVGMSRGIYDNPYDAFTNYMNILGDFINRVNTLYPADIDNEELNSLLTTIKNQGEEIERKDKEIEKLLRQLKKVEGDKVENESVADGVKKSAAPSAKAPAKAAAKAPAKADPKKSSASKSAAKAPAKKTTKK
jgi:alpha-amylase